MTSNSRTSHIAPIPGNVGNSQENTLAQEERQMNQAFSQASPATRKYLLGLAQELAAIDLASALPAALRAPPALRLVTGVFGG